MIHNELPLAPQPSRMTKDERLEISKFLRANEKVAIAGAEHQEAALKADFESKLSAVYPKNHPAWDASTEIAEEAIAQANERIRQVCKDLGVPATFAPSAGLNWMSRGENAFKERRAELRKTAYAIIAEIKAKTIFAIKSETVKLLGQVVSDSLTTDAARQFMAALPTPEALMKPLDFAEVEKRAKRLTDSERGQLRYQRDDWFPGAES